MFCVVGAYTLSNSVVEVIIMIGFGIAGYLMRKVDLDPAPLVLAFVLGNILETNFRQALLVGQGYAEPVLHASDRRVAGGLLRRADRAAGRPRHGNRDEALGGDASQPSRRF